MADAEASTADFSVSRGCATDVFREPILTTSIPMTMFLVLSSTERSFSRSDLSNSSSRSATTSSELWIERLFSNLTWRSQTSSM
jgi:hypothetical protein